MSTPVSDRAWRNGPGRLLITTPQLSPGFREMVESTLEGPFRRVKAQSAQAATRFKKLLSSILIASGTEAQRNLCPRPENELPHVSSSAVPPKRTLKEEVAAWRADFNDTRHTNLDYYAEHLPAVNAALQNIDDLEPFYRQLAKTAGSESSDDSERSRSPRSLHNSESRGNSRARYRSRSRPRSRPPTPGPSTKRSLAHNYRAIGRRIARYYNTNKEDWEAGRAW
ncbi:hypothetical protein JCM10207_005826 [Rhodosporidiobolus poonsookiae]